MKRWSLLLLCIFVWGMCPVTVNAQTPSKIEISYQDGELSADLENAALEDVLKVITERTGLEILVNDDVTTTEISVAFKGLDLDKGLKKILGRINYAFVYGADRSIIKVEIFGKIFQNFPDLPVEEPPAVEADQGAPPPTNADGRVQVPPQDANPDAQPSGDAPPPPPDADGNTQEPANSGG